MYRRQPPLLARMVLPRRQWGFLPSKNVRKRSTFRTFHLEGSLDTDCILQLSNSDAGWKPAGGRDSGEVVDTNRLTTPGGWILGGSRKVKTALSSRDSRLILPF